MADNLGPEDMNDLWRNQPVEPLRLSPDDLRLRAQLLEAKMRRGVLASAVLMSFLAAGYASFLYFFPATVHRIGVSLTLAGYLCCAYQLRRINRSFANAPGDEASPTGARYRKELERQRDFSLTMWKTFMLPLVPGPAVLAAGFLIPSQGPVPGIILTAALIAAPFLLAIPLGRRKARVLQREIDELDSLKGPS